MGWERSETKLLTTNLSITRPNGCLLDVVLPFTEGLVGTPVEEDNPPSSSSRKFCSFVWEIRCGETTGEEATDEEGEVEGDDVVVL